jgi:hypothetical protein
MPKHDRERAAYLHSEAYKDAREYLEEKTVEWRRAFTPVLGAEFTATATIAEMLNRFIEMVVITKQEGAPGVLPLILDEINNTIDADYLSVKRLAGKSPKSAKNQVARVLEKLRSLEKRRDGRYEYRSTTLADIFNLLDALDTIPVDYPRAYQAWQEGKVLSVEEFTGLTPVPRE